MPPERKEKEYEETMQEKTPRRNFLKNIISAFTGEPANQKEGVKVSEKIKDPELKKMVQDAFTIERKEKMVTEKIKSLYPDPMQYLVGGIYVSSYVMMVYLSTMDDEGIIDAYEKSTRNLCNAQMLISNGAKIENLYEIISDYMSFNMLIECRLGEIAERYAESRITSGDFYI